MGQLGLGQTIKCFFGFHVMDAFNYYTKSHILYYNNACINCGYGIHGRYIRLLKEEERSKPIWEILGTTQDVYYNKDNKLRTQFLEVSDSSTSRKIDDDNNQKV